MSDDLIERLEEPLCADGYKLRREAAVEIERLREEANGLAKPLEQIRQVCADNAGKASNHKMALDFVHQIAIRALKEQK